MYIVHCTHIVHYYGREKYQDFGNCKRTSLLTRVRSYTLRVRTYVIQSYKSDPDIGIHSKSFWFGEQEWWTPLCNVSHLNFWDVFAFEPRELKGIVQQPATKEGYQSIGLAFLHNHQCSLDTLKGLLLCFKFQKTGYSVRGPKKVKSFLMWSALPKTQKCVTLCYRLYSYGGGRGGLVTWAVAQFHNALLMLLASLL